MQSVVSPQPSDISRLKKSVPLSPARCITFAAVAATLLTLGCTDASIVPLSLNRSVRSSKQCPQGLGRNSYLRTDKTEQSEKATGLRARRKSTFFQQKVHFLPEESPLSFRGLGNPDWLWSAPHGAGRLMSRKQAFDTLRMQDFADTMSDIYSTSVCPETIDESPMAYKPMQEIIDQIGDTVEIIDIIKPIYNFKAKNGR